MLMLRISLCPDEVDIRFRLATGAAERDTLTRVGQATPGRDGFQLFRYEFKHVAPTMTFDIRWRPMTAFVICDSRSSDRPELIGMEVGMRVP